MADLPDRVAIVTSPPDCDLSGPWEVVEEYALPGGDSHVRLRQGNSYFGTQRSNASCPGHEPAPHEPAGMSVYCDGACATGGSP